MLDHSHAAPSDDLSQLKLSATGILEPVVPLAKLVELRELALETAGASKEAVASLIKLSNSTPHEGIRDIATLILCEVALSDIFTGSRVDALEALQERGAEPLVDLVTEALRRDANLPERVRELVSAIPVAPQFPHAIPEVGEVRDRVRASLIDVLEAAQGYEPTAQMALELVASPRIPPIREESARSYGPFENFQEFLGYDRCPVDLRSIEPGSDTKVLFLPWMHVSQNVPGLGKEMETVLAGRDVRKLLVLAECVADKERKERMDYLLNRYINGDVQEAKEALEELNQPVRDEQGHKLGKLNPTFIDLAKELKRIKGDSSYEVVFSAIDITDPVLLEKAKLELGGTMSQALGGIGMLMSKPKDLKNAHRPKMDDEKRGEVLKEYVLDREELKIRILERLLTTRNAVMSSQTHEARATMEEGDVMFALAGAAHAAIVYDGLKDGTEAFRYVGIPDRFLEMVPESVSLQEMTDLASKTAIELSMGKPISKQELERAALETIMNTVTAIEVFKESLLSLGFSRPYPEIRGGVARGYTIRTALLMTPQEEISGVLDEIVTRVIEARDTKGEKTVYGVCASVLKDWILEAHPDAERKGSVSFSRWLNKMFDRYLRVEQ